jgi:hypothetical protein
VAWAKERAAGVAEGVRKKPSQEQQPPQEG